jgi:glycosyltransferase involved in cell wall biosynthesis
MRFLIGADVPPDPDSGAAGTVVQTSLALRALGCEVEEFWAADLGRRIRHGNLHYAFELPRAYRREVARRMGRRAFDVVMLSQPHAFLAGEYLKHYHPDVLFFNRTHGWEGQFHDAMRKYFPASQEAPPPKRIARQVMESILIRHQRRVLQVADAIVSGSSEVADYLEHHYRFPRDRVVVLPHGVPDAFIKTAVERDDARWRKVLYVGQYAAFKAPEIVAAVFNKILREHPESHGGWVCDARDHDRVRRSLDQNVVDRVTLYSSMPQDALIRVYDAHGLFIFPSYYEGFGKTPFEAMARGLAVVSSRVGGMADLIRSGENGFLVEPGDEDAMIKAVHSLLANPEVAMEAGRQARETARRLTWENLAKGLLAFAERVKRG